MLTKTGSTTTLTYTNIKAKGGLNLYAWKLNDSLTTSSSYKERKGTNTGRANWVTKKAALVVKYMEINTLFEAWFKIAEAYTNVVAGNKTCTIAGSIRE